MTKKNSKKTKKVPESPQQLKLPELFVYKLDKLVADIVAAKQVVVQPIQVAYEKAALQAIAKDPGVLAAETAKAKCLDDLVEVTKLPKGFEITGVNTIDAVIVAELKQTE